MGTVSTFVDTFRRPFEAPARPQPQDLAQNLSPFARIYTSSVMVAGALLMLLLSPRSLENPPLFLALVALSIVASSMKVALPVPGKSGATMSVSYVANFVSLLLVGPNPTMLVAGAGAWMQCAVNRKRNTGLTLYRTLFSVAALVITVQATGLAYAWLGGVPGNFGSVAIVKPLVGGAIVYFLVNTWLVACAISLVTNHATLRVWHETFLWSAPSYFVGAGMALLAAWLVASDSIWFTPLAAAPVYLTYRTYRVYLGRIEDEQRHVREASELHAQAMEALELANQSQQALTAEKERLAVTLRSLGEAVIATDLDGNVVLMNRTAELFTGCAQDHACGRPLPSVLKLVDGNTGEACENPVRLILQRGRSSEEACRAALVGHDGVQRLVQHTGTAIRSTDGQVEGVVLVVRDVTDAVRLEEERQKAGRLASLGVLAGGIAHDFNNILTAIVGNISLARLDGSLDRHVDAHMAEAEKACGRAKALTHQLLTFSKGGTPVKQPLQLNDLARESSSFALRGSNVNCQFALTDDLWTVEADEGQMGQVMHNLVLNAQQAMPNGGTVTVRTQNVLGCNGHAAHLSAAQVRITIEDHGLGIPEEHLARVFDPYFTTKSQGSGLGLATAYSIVRNHGGRIDLSSIVNHGTTVMVTLPARPDRRPAPREHLPAPRAGSGRVLVMDDEESIRDVATAMLARLGYDVEVAADGREAIEKYKASRQADREFDVVVMDLTVPGGMGGKDAIKDLLRINPRVRAIVSSGYADDPVMAEFRQYGFKGVVPKPFATRDLCNVLQQVLE
jgi:PAS domain S-box-containing protein